MNTIYLKTLKAELEGAKLPDELRRVLSILDGRSGSEDLAKRAAPSLRKTWSRLLSELVKGGYIVPDKRPKIEAKDSSAPKPRAAVSANDPEYQKKVHAVEQMIAVLAAAEKVDREKSAIEIERMIAILQAADGVGTTKLDTGANANAKSDIQQRAERAARIAELKGYFAAEKEKAKAEIKQAEMQAAAIARKKAETKAKSSAAGKDRESEADLPLPNLKRPSTPPKPGRT